MSIGLFLESVSDDSAFKSGLIRIVAYKIMAYAFFEQHLFPAFPASAQQASRESGKSQAKSTVPTSGLSHSAYQRHWRHQSPGITGFRHRFWRMLTSIGRGRQDEVGCHYLSRRRKSVVLISFALKWMMNLRGTRLSRCRISSVLLSVLRTICFRFCASKLIRIHSPFENEDVVECLQLRVAVRASTEIAW